MSVFSHALIELKGKDIASFGPMSFREYLTKHNIKNVNTPRYISINSLEQLDQELSDNDTTVLRLGRAERSLCTQFVLIKVRTKLKDFFIIDQDIFDSFGETFLPRISMRQLFTYYLLPHPSESTLINLGLASGLLSYALGLDEIETGIPATGRTTYTFQLKAHSSLNKEFLHNSGQVEIDSMFLGKREGVEILFVIEGKTNPHFNSLSKHKLAYPVLAISKDVPPDIPIIPIYLKVIKSTAGYHYHVVECNFPDPRIGLEALDTLVVTSYKHLVLPRSLEL